jgi:lactam utilization protein B
MHLMSASQVQHTTTHASLYNANDMDNNNNNGVFSTGRQLLNTEKLMFTTNSAGLIHVCSMHCSDPCTAIADRNTHRPIPGVCIIRVMSMPSLWW